MELYIIRQKSTHWKCSRFRLKFQDSKETRTFAIFFSIGTKESAYIHALTSAGIAYAITKACSTGRLRSCGCDLTMREKNTNSSIRWAGCSDNVLFGTEIARKFVNLRERKVTNRVGLVNLHNNHFGIRVKCFVFCKNLTVFFFEI